MNKWNLISETLNQKYFSEYELEVAFRLTMHFVLGWPYRNIKRQSSLARNCPNCGSYGSKARSDNGRLDLLLSDDSGAPGIVFEMKRQDIRLEEDQAKQLLDYMKAKNAKFGFLISTRISLYYIPEDSDNLVRVLTIPFRDSTNILGYGLASALEFSNFNCGAFLDYCEKMIFTYQKYNEKMLSLKIERLLPLMDSYNDWLLANFNEQQYMINRIKSANWVYRNFFDADISKISNEQFLQLFKQIPAHLTNIRSSMRYYITKDKEILAKRSGFTLAIDRLKSIQEEGAFTFLDDFTTNNNLRVKSLGKAFWSEFLVCRFPNLPMMNEKTLNFFDVIDVYLGETRAEQLNFVKNFYDNILETTDIETIDSVTALTHLEHYVMYDGKKQRSVDEAREFVLNVIRSKNIEA